MHKYIKEIETLAEFQVISAWDRQGTMKHKQGHYIDECLSLSNIELCIEFFQKSCDTFYSLFNSISKEAGAIEINLNEFLNKIDSMLRNDPFQLISMIRDEISTFKSIVSRVVHHIEAAKSETEQFRNKELIKLKELVGVFAEDLTNTMEKVLQIIQPLRKGRDEFEREYDIWMTNVENYKAGLSSAKYYDCSWKMKSKTFIEEKNVSNVLYAIPGSPQCFSYFWFHCQSL
jgi:hypothetical protein